MGWEERDYHRAGGGGGGFGGGGGMQSVFGFLNKSFPIGTYLDVRVRVHILFILLVGFQLLISMGGDGGPWWVLRWSSLLFFSVLAHEFGHVLGCRSVGGSANEILMWPLGGLAFCDAPKRPWPEFVTVACGPLVNVVIGAACYAVLLATPGVMPVSLNPFEILGAYTGGWRGLVGDLFFVNYMLLLFNMVLVFYPFDGGRLVQVALWTMLGYRRSMVIATRVGMGGAVLVAIVGLMSRELMLIFIGAFGFYTCYQQGRVLRYTDTDLYGMNTSGGGDSGYAAALHEQQQSRRGGRNRWAERRARKKQEEDQRLTAEVDRILAKVREQGLASLTRKEKKTLQQATERQREAG